MLVCKKKKKDVHIADNTHDVILHTDVWHI